MSIVRNTMYAVQRNGLLFRTYTSLLSRNFRCRYSNSWITLKDLLHSLKWMNKFYFGWPGESRGNPLDGRRTKMVAMVISRWARSGGGRLSGEMMMMVIRPIQKLRKTISCFIHLWHLHLFFPSFIGMVFQCNRRQMNTFLFFFWGDGKIIN